MRLNPIVRKKIISDGNMEKICVDTGTPYPTFRRWISNNSEKLTLKKVIEAIAKHTQVDEADLFIEDKERV